MKFAYKPETVKTKHQIAGFKAKFLGYNKKSKSIKTIYCPKSLIPL